VSLVLGFGTVGDTDAANSREDTCGGIQVNISVLLLLVIVGGIAYWIFCRGSDDSSNE
jgi:hypothetical protein